MTQEDEEWAASGRAAFRAFMRGAGRVPRRVLLLAAVAAPIFIFGVFLMRREPGYGAASPDVVVASGCFQNLITTLLWLIGFCLTVSGGFKYYRALKNRRNVILHDRLESSAQRRLLAGILMLVFPYVQVAMQQSIYEAYFRPVSDAPLFEWLGLGFFVAGACRFRSAVRFPENSPERIWRRNRGLAYIALCLGCLLYPLLEQACAPDIDFWGNRVNSCTATRVPTVTWLYFAFMSFLIADVNLLHARRLKDDPSSAALPKAHAAFCFAAGFMMLAAPMISAF